MVADIFTQFSHHKKASFGSVWDLWGYIDFAFGECSFRGSYRNNNNNNNNNNKNNNNNNDNNNKIMVSFKDEKETLFYKRRGSIKRWKSLNYWTIDKYYFSNL